MAVDIFGDSYEEDIIEDIPEDKKVGLFDIISDITFDKKYIFVEKSFDTFMTVRALSQHHDTILYANEVNKLSFKNKLFAHDYLFYSIKKKKRYGKWAKKDEESDLLSLVKRKYALNNDVARSYLNIMTDEDKQKLKNDYVIGGCK